MISTGITAGVIGWPIQHSKSPLIHRFWLRQLGLDGDYARFAVAPHQLEQALRALPALGLAGVNVTVPHKVAVIPHLDRVEQVAKDIGAVNTILVRGADLVGTNTDMAGFLEPLAGMAGKRAVVVGAGGAARAVLVGLRQQGIAHVTVLNRTPARAAGLLKKLAVPGEARPLDAPLPAADLLVNTSPLGMHGQPPLALDLAPLPRTAIVYDIVYAPLQTALLQQAAALGLATIDGLRMLVGQAAIAFERFYGVPPPRSADDELRRLLLAS